MSGPHDWLPPLVCLEEFRGDVGRYIEAVYQCFHSDFVESRPNLAGKRVGINKIPIHDGKETTFWHIASEATQSRRETDRLPNLRRCERIRWPRPIVEGLKSGRILYWESNRNGKHWISLALADFSYVVVLADRGEYCLLWTAYPVDWPRTLKTLQREFEEYQRRRQKG